MRDFPCCIEKNGRNCRMKTKKRYYVACVLMCILALALSVTVFNLEMGLARYSKLNSVVRDSWIETSASDPETGVNTDLFITRIYKEGEAEGAAKWSYLGKQTVVQGKYVAYGQEVYGSGIVINGEAKMGDRVSIYYKPDAPTTVYSITNYTIYLLLLIAALVIAVVIIFLCRMINKSLKENTFSDSAVTFMDIPMAVMVAGFVIAFFAGMFIGSIQVDSSYTAISQGLAEMYANHELQF